MSTGQREMTRTAAGRADASAAGRALARRAPGLAVWLLGTDRAEAESLGAWVFSGDPAQVRVVRQFVRDMLAGHPACQDTVAAASELASNAVMHSLSGAGRGRFVVQAVELGTGHAGLVVTDQGGPPVPPVPACVGEYAESGRGLVLVRSLSCWFRIRDHPGGCRSFAAAIRGTCGTGRACGPADWIELGW